MKPGGDDTCVDLAIANPDPQCVIRFQCFDGLHGLPVGIECNGITAFQRGQRTHRMQGAGGLLQGLAFAFQPMCHGLAQALGLFGELLLLRTLLDTFDEFTVLDWWLGPLAEERDYAFPAFDAEVKTTLGESRTHVIHGAGQLEPSPGRSLWLVSIQITRAGGDPKGIGLPGLVNEIRERLTATRDQFVSHLASEGWDDDDAAMYPTAYVLRMTPAAYLVDDDFPAVTPGRLRAMVPHSDLVSDVTYRVDVSGRTAGSPGDPLDAFVATLTAQEA